MILYGQPAPNTPKISECFSAVVLNHISFAVPLVWSRIILKFPCVYNTMPNFVGVMLILF